jgi:hypothetical protein
MGILFHLLRSSHPIPSLTMFMVEIAWGWTVPNAKSPKITALVSMAQARCVQGKGASIRACVSAWQNSMGLFLLRHLDPELLKCQRRGGTSLRGTDQEALHDQVGFIHLLKGITFFTDGHGK